MGKRTGKADYEVGRGKPPRHTQFPPGRSGNPGGRKKNSVNLQTIVDRVLNSEIVLTEQGRTRKGTISEALLLRCAQSGLAGNQRAIEFLLALLAAQQKPDEGRPEDLDQDDRDILEAGLRARRGRHDGDRSDPDDSDGDAS